MSSVSSNVSVWSVTPSRTYYHGRNSGADSFTQRRLLVDEFIGRVARRSSRGDKSSYWKRKYESECEVNNRGSVGGGEYAFNNRGGGNGVYAFKNCCSGGSGGSVHSNSVHSLRGLEGRLKWLKRLTIIWIPIVVTGIGMQMGTLF